MKKFFLVLLVTVMLFSVLAGCGAKETKETAETATTETTETTDVVTTASLVNEADAFLKAASKDGTWIICPLSDLTIDKEIVVEGEFHNKADAAQDIYRKIGLYAQDADHKVTAEYKVTAPKMTVKSENLRIQNGTFAGDIYVEAKGFNLKGAKIEGNIYFANEDVKSTFAMDDKSSVSGATEVKK